MKGRSMAFREVIDYAELERLARTFADGEEKFLLVIGNPGTGKSTAMRNAMEEHKHKWIEGVGFALDLHCSIHEARSRPIVLDDMDMLLRDAKSRDIVKKLTEENNVRTMRWGNPSSKALKERGVPYLFKTTSHVCFILNEWKSKDVSFRAVLSRSEAIDFVPSPETIHAKVTELGWCDEEVLAWIGMHLDAIRDMRNYRRICKWKTQGMDWRKVAGETFLQVTC